MARPGDFEFEGAPRQHVLSEGVKENRWLEVGMEMEQAARKFGADITTDWVITKETVSNHEKMIARPRRSAGATKPRVIAATEVAPERNDEEDDFVEEGDEYTEAQTFVNGTLALDDDDGSGGHHSSYGEYDGDERYYNVEYRSYV